MSEALRGGIRPLEPPLRREPLSPEHSGNLLSAIGNSELKAGLIILMNPGREYSATSLRQQAIQAQGNKPGWIMGLTVPFQFCETTFSEIGFVTKVKVDYHGRKLERYILTEEGIKNGKPLAALLLDFSYHDKHSLYDYFGATRSTVEGIEYEEEGVSAKYKERSPQRRYAIFYELVTEGKPLRIADLSEKLGLPPERILNHLDELAKAGIITFDKIEGHSPFSYYKISETPKLGLPPSKKYRHQSTITSKVYEIISTRPEKYWAIQEVVDELKQNGHPDIASLYTDVSTILAHLASPEVGFLDRMKFKYDHRSNISLTPEQRDPLVRLVTIIDGFQNQYPTIIEQGMDLADVIASNPAELTALMKKAKQSSRYANRNTPYELARMVLSIIGEDSSLSIRNIEDLLEESFEKRMTYDGIGRFMARLRRANLVSAEMVKGITRWKAVEGADVDRLEFLGIKI